MTLKYLDQTGLSLMLSIGSTWFKRGSGKQFEIPTRWGSSGRINLIGTYSLHGTEEQLEVRELSGSCNGEQVMAYLDTLALRRPRPDDCGGVGQRPFHKGAKLREKAAEWEKQGLYLRYLPPYAPMLNLIEEIWRKLKGIVMPRRCYNSVDELREAVLTGLKVLGARFI
ncbi:transposase [Deinococcus wulumuqiensis]|uniref:transposase n=1 Tax=Deinococcus wulumuqiensis TaxID=980427 RepID=UPI00178C374D|nr:transposase [Deinococcus wulumuqiensis]